MVAAKKRRVGKPGRGRQRTGLSGNPQRRALQLREGSAAGLAHGASAFQPGRRSWPWWAGSHRQVLEQVRAAEWPAHLLDAEALAGQLAGDEFYRRLNAPGPGTGFTPAGWWQALAEAALDALDADLAMDGKEWAKLWAFCCGVVDEETREELENQGRVITAQGLVAVPGVPVPWYQPTAGADVLVARDAYGARFLLVAAFSDPGRPGDPDHWYAWDLDWCVHGLVVAAGTYDSAAEALAEWRASVSPAAATELASCPPELCIRLLSQALPGSFQAASVLGDEPAEFFREMARLSRRASVLAASQSRLLAGVPSRLLADSRDSVVEEFLDWHAGHSADARGEVAERLDLLLGEWGPDAPPDEQAFLACSPHRIQACATILRDSYEPDWVNTALPLLPVWIRWCASKASLDDEAVAHALAAARAEAVSWPARPAPSPETKAPSAARNSKRVPARSPALGHQVTG
jgi:hypothetical protein